MRTHSGAASILVTSLSLAYISVMATCASAQDERTGICRRYDVCREIEATGGQCIYDFDYVEYGERPFLMEFRFMLGELFGHHWFSSVISAVVAVPEDDHTLLYDLDALSSLVTLHLIELPSSTIEAVDGNAGRDDNADLEALREMPDLQSLILQCFEIGHGEFPVLDAAHLHMLALQGEGVELTDVDLSAIAEHNELFFLCVGGEGISDEGLALLSDGLGDLEILGVSRASVTHDGIARLESLPHLRGLVLEEISFSDDELDTLNEIFGTEVIHVSATTESECN